MRKKVKVAIPKISEEAEERRKLWNYSVLDVSRNQSLQPRASSISKKKYPG